MIRSLAQLTAHKGRPRMPMAVPGLAAALVLAASAAFASAGAAGASVGSQAGSGTGI